MQGPRGKLRKRRGQSAVGGGKMQGGLQGTG